MAITKTVKIDKIEIIGDSKHIQVREATIIKEDGVELTRSFHRYVLSPGDDLSLQPTDIQNIANSLWTEELITSYLETLKNQ